MFRNRNNSWTVGSFLVFISFSSTILLDFGVGIILYPENGMNLAQDDNSIWENFFSVFGLVYAIIVGLLIVEAHRRVRELSAAVQSELNALGDINDYLRYFNAENRVIVCQVLERLHDYMDDVILDMKPTMHRPLAFEAELELQQKNSDKRTFDDRRRRHIREIIDKVGALKPTDKNDQSALEAIIKKVSDLTTFRAQKTDIARRGFPKSYYITLIAMSCAIIGGFVLMEARSPWVHALIVGLVTGAMFSLYRIIRDLDNPLDGKWNIQNETEASIDLVREIVNRQLREAL